MRIYIYPNLFLLFVITTLTSCQQTSDNTNYFSTIEKNTLEQEQASEGLSQNHNYIDLSLSTFEQQNIDKEKAAKKLEDAKKERVEVVVDKSKDYTNNVNVASFARNTKNKKGEKVYTRLSFSIYDNWIECSKFKNKDEAQRNFLKDGGPFNDRFNLDPDGDGFACDWDPDIYRELSIPKD